MSAWMDAHAAMVARIEGHRDFARLVREVAVAEAPAMPGQAWAQRNSLTYGAWMSRGSVWPGQHRKGERARVLAERMAAELEFWEGAAAAERTAAVYVAARQHVQARLRGLRPSPWNQARLEELG